MTAAASVWDREVPAAPSGAVPVDVLRERVYAALSRVRNFVQAHAGDVEVVEVTEEGDVTLAFRGTCVSCPAQAMTIGTAVLPAVEKVEGVRKIHLDGMIVSQAAVRRIRAMVP